MTVGLWDCGTALGQGTMGQQCDSGKVKQWDSVTVVMRLVFENFYSQDS